MAVNKNCEKCQAPLIAKNDWDWILAVTDFPADPLGAYIILAAGPGNVPCKRCTHINQLGLPHLVRGPNNQDVVFLPSADQKAGPSESMILRAVSRARNGADESSLTVTRDKRSFRRAFLTKFVNQSGTLLNQCVLARENKFEWIRANKEKFNAAFFAGAWLLTTGPIPVYNVSAENAPASTMVPHETAPPAASHVVAQHKAKQGLATRLGDLLGWLLVVWTIEALEERSWQKAREASAMGSELILADPVLEAANSVIEARISEIKPEIPGRVALEYGFEAAMAIFCQANKKQNPRRSKWTRIQLIYDFFRRLDGNDDSILLPPEYVRETIDEFVFWQCYEQLGREFGFARVTKENELEFFALADAAARIYPETVPNTMKAMMIVPSKRLQR